MDLHIESETPVKGIILLRAKGGIDGATYQYLENAVEELDDRDDLERIVLDLTGVTYMSSCGIGLLMRLHNGAATKGRSLVLMGLGEAVRHVLQTTRLLSYFTVKEKREEALQTVSGVE